MRRKGDKVRGDEGAGNPCLPNSTPNHMVTITDRDSGTGSRAKKGGRGQSGKGDEKKEGDSFEETGMGLRPGMSRPRRARMRSLANATSRVGTMVAGIDDDGNLMDDEDPFVLSSSTTTTLGEPSGMDPRVLISLTGGRGEGTLKGIKRVKDPSTDVETMGVTKYLNVISNGVEIPDSKPMSGP